MTVPVPDQLEYIDDANGVTKDFAYPKRFLQKDEVVVALRDADGVDTQQVLGTHYTIAGSTWPTGGTVSFITAPQAPNKVVRYRMTQAKQTVALNNLTRNDAPSVETQLDRMTMAIQDRGARTDASWWGLLAEITSRILGDKLLNGRVDKEIIDRENGDKTLASLIAQGGPIEVPVYDTRMAVAFAAIKPTIASIRTGGFSAPGDGGAALYKRVSSEPSHAGKVQSADGAWWELVYNGANTIQQFGAIDNGSAIDQAFNDAVSRFPGKVIRFPYIVSGVYGFNSVTNFDGIIVDADPNTSFYAQAGQTSSIKFHSGSERTSKVSTPTRDYTWREDDLQKHTLSLAKGTAGFTWDCYGDSTQYGADFSVSGNRVDLPPPETCQRILRAYFGVSDIYVNNKALPGTTLKGAIAGADGSGKTLEQRISEGGADFATINFAINDMGVGSPTPPEEFEDELREFVRLCRAYGTVPGIISPVSLTAVSGDTSVRARLITHYKRIVRRVAASENVEFIDVDGMFSAMLRSGDFAPRDLIPDGTHPNQKGYTSIGCLMASAVINPSHGFTGPDQFMSVGSGSVLSTGQPAYGAQPLMGSKLGVQLITPSENIDRSIRVVFKVEEPGLDVYLAYQVWASGHPQVNISVDEQFSFQISQNDLAMNTATFVADHEVLVMKNASVGTHMIKMSSTDGVGSLGMNYIRTRKTIKPYSRSSNVPLSGLLRTAQLAKETYLTVSNGAYDATVLLDDVNFDSRTEGVSFRFKSNMAKGEYFAIHSATKANNVSLGGAQMLVGIGLEQSTGFLTLAIANGVSGYTFTALGNVDLSGVERVYSVQIPANSGTRQISGSVTPGASFGPANITKPYYGGVAGLSKSGNGTMLITDLTRVLS